MDLYEFVCTELKKLTKSNSETKRCLKEADYKSLSLAFQTPIIKWLVLIKCCKTGKTGFESF
ncbi:MAG: hypothetical protein IJU23_09605, partial [Proteobacteria bacterium]|nr:hypothetical protein [Pseudomonadota bacterium]